MKEQFVTYEIALKLKALGFDEKFIFFGSTIMFIDGNFSSCTDSYVELLPEKEYIIAPLWQQVIDWLREVYKIHILIQRIIGNRGTSIESESWTFEGTAWKSWPTYYKAREQSILRALELITNK